MKIDLNDESRSLLDSLNAWREKVVVGELPGIHGLSHSVELKLHDFLTSQLDLELISHNTIVADHKKRVNDVLQKGHELLKVRFSLRREKVELEEKLLS